MRKLDYDVYLLPTPDDKRHFLNLLEKNGLGYDGVGTRAVYVEKAGIDAKALGWILTDAKRSIILLRSEPKFWLKLSEDKTTRETRARLRRLVEDYEP